MLEDAPERKNVQRSLYISLPGRLWLPRELLEAVLTLLWLDQARVDCCGHLITAKFLLVRDSSRVVCRALGVRLGILFTSSNFQIWGLCGQE